MFDSLNWVMIGLAAAFGLAGLSYYSWVFGVRSKMEGLRHLRIRNAMARLRGQFDARDPADEVQQALHDALNGAPALGETPDEDLWIPEVRQSGRHPIDDRQLEVGHLPQTPMRSR